MNKITKHHCVPRSKWGTSNPENITKLKDNIHIALHQLFANMTPSEQIKHILDINTEAIQWDFRADILKIIDLYNEDIYHLRVKKKWKD